MVFCNIINPFLKINESIVTILILIDGFLQCVEDKDFFNPYMCHNPYFNRWFSAMDCTEEKRRLYKCHNPYFNRWFSAIIEKRKFIPQK